MTKNPVVKNYITSVSSFLKWIEGLPPRDHFVRLYRGHPDKQYQLQPSLFRERAHRKDEKNILREILSLQPGEFETDKGAFEQLVRMQHYGLKTRLLDLTFNPLVALYFACKGSSATEDDKDGEIIQLSVFQSAIKYFDSDTVSCVANLAKLTGKERDVLRNTDSKLELNNCGAGKRLLQFIRSEKPYFLSEIEPRDLKDSWVVKARQTNRRLLAQHGAFLLFGLTTEFDEAEELSVEITRRTIPASSKQTIINQLDRININRSSLFPEIENAASYILSKLTPLPMAELY